VNVFSAEIRRGDLVVVSEIATNDDKGYVIMTRRGRPRIGDDFVRWFIAETRSGQVEANGSRRRARRPGDRLDR
jgi:hypothetical protein